jgi:hypothetical protein
MKTAIDGDPIVYDFAAKAFEREDDEREINRVLDDIVRVILENTKASHYLGFLGNGHSFRREISLKTVRIFSEESNKKEKYQYVQTYKGNRDGKPKPKWYYHVRKRLVDKWGFHLVADIEADDAVAICNNFFDEIVIAGIDKDLRTVPCLFYNIRTKKFERVTVEQAKFNFCFQLIAGDSGDCITGIPGMGEVKAMEFLKTHNPEDYEQLIEAMYEETFGVLGKEAFTITKRLVTLLYSWPYFKIPEPIPNPHLKLMVNTTIPPLDNTDF